MTPLDRAHLLQIAKLVIATSIETDPEVREVALEEAVRRLVGMAKQKPWQPKSGRYQLVDIPKVRGVELTAGELSRLVELASGKGDEELAEKLRTL